MKLQKQDCRGTWNDLDDQETESHIDLLQTKNGPHAETGLIGPRWSATRDATRDEIISALESGAKLRNHPEDWYSVSRMKPAPVAPRPEPELVKCSCGHSVPRVQVMSASMGTSCPDCYDEMS